MYTIARTAQPWECALTVWPPKAATGAQTPKHVQPLELPIAIPSHHVMLTVVFTVTAAHVLARRAAVGAKPQVSALTPPFHRVFWLTPAPLTKNVEVSMEALSLEECFWLLVLSLFPLVGTSSIVGESEKESRILNCVKKTQK